MNDQQAVDTLAALAQMSRLQIFRQLVVAGAQGMTPSQLSQALGLPATALSFHLKELKHADLVTQEREGRQLIYRAAFGTVNDILAYLTANCCQGQACAVVTEPACTSC